MWFEHFLYLSTVFLAGHGKTRNKNATSSPWIFVEAQLLLTKVCFNLAYCNDLIKKFALAVMRFRRRCQNLNVYPCLIQGPTYQSSAGIQFRSVDDMLSQSIHRSN